MTWVHAHVDGSREVRVEDQVMVELSPGAVLCERCGLMMEGSELDLDRWLRVHRCDGSLEAAVEGFERWVEGK